MFVLPFSYRTYTRVPPSVRGSPGPDDVIAVSTVGEHGPGPPSLVLDEHVPVGYLVLTPGTASQRLSIDWIVPRHTPWFGHSLRSYAPYKVVPVGDEEAE